MHIRQLIEAFSSRLMIVAAVSSSTLVLVIALALYLRARPMLDIEPLPELLLGRVWLPSQGLFGFYPSIIGTIYITLLAMLFSVPLSILSSIYLAEYASSGLRSKVLPLIDLLAGIPPVVFGLWGTLVIVPMVAIIAANLAGLGSPLLRSDYYSTGFCLLSGGLVLAIMVFPIIISISVPVLRAVPMEMRESSLSLGATRWQTVKHVLMRIALPGISAAIILGFSRAFGETMAVLMVIGNVPIVPSSIFDPALPLPALIANNYGETMSIPLYDSALLLAALLLMLVILIFTVAARLILIDVKRRMNGV